MMVKNISDELTVCRRLIRGLMVITIAIFVSGCAGHIVSGTVENRIEDRLPELIGPAKSYDVKLHGSTGKIVRGQVREIEIHGKEVEVVSDLRIDTLDVLMKDVEADTKTSVLKKVGGMSFEAVVSEDALNSYLARIRPEKPRVELLDGKIVVNVREKVLVLSSNVRLTGKLIPSGNQLNFRVDKLEVSGIKTPSIAAKAVEDRINPILELELSGFEPELKSATIVPDAIKITGTAHLVGGPSDRVGTGKYRQ